MRRFVALLCLLLPSVAQAYDYPYTDPYYATITAAILKADLFDKGARYQDLKLRLLPERDNVPFYGADRNFLKLRLWAQNRPAPLVILVSGLGGAASASYNNYLGYELFKRGFHVLAFPSPFHFSFALAASQTGFPGITRADSADLYEAMQAGVKLLHERGMTVTAKGLLGVSMGALEAAYVAELDARERSLDFSRVLLINPPVKPLESAARLDALVAEGAGLSAEARKNLQENTYLFGIKQMTMRDIKAPDYFLHVEEELPTSLAERKFLVGSSFRDFLEALIFTTQQVRDLGVLKTPVATGKPDERLKECRGFSYREYLEKFLQPAVGLPKEAVARDVNLEGMAEQLKKDERVSVMHNEDDFILGSGDLDSIHEIFGARARIYPHGGHVGNVWYPENLEFILGYFAPLK